MNLIVCGGRKYADREAVRRYLDTLNKPFTVVTGGATGADALANQWAVDHKLPTRIFPADWSQHGGAAGPIRNKRMLDEMDPVAVVAFPGGRGTADMVRQARARGIPVHEPVLARDEVDAIRRILSEGKS